MSAQTIFIQTIAPYVQKLARQYGYKYPSAIIAQACIESAYGASTLSAKYHNYFGIKWYKGCGRNAVNMKTNEEYTPGVLTSITSGFMVGNNMEDGVWMYFDFLQRNSRYKNLKQATSSLNYLELIKADGYATSSTYVNSTYAVVKSYNLLQYDGTPAAEPKKVSYAGVVTASALNVRTGASTYSSVAQVANHNFVLPKGIVIAIDAEMDGWGRLASTPWWVSLQYVRK